MAARLIARRHERVPERLPHCTTGSHRRDCVVTREYYVRNSQEFIDYVMAGATGPLLAIEAKPLQTDLTDKHAAQLIQYCAVEGIEWAALTNGRELQFFNSFLKPDLAAKRVLRLDLLAFNSDVEFDALFGQIWQLSRESMTKPSGVRTWLNQRRLDTALRSILLDSSSPTIRQLRKRLAAAEINATTQDVAHWFRGHLGAPITILPNSQQRNSEKGPRSTHGIGSPDNSALSLPSGTRGTRSNMAETSPHSGAGADTRKRKTHLGITLRNLVDGGLLPANTELLLIGRGGSEVARARLTAAGDIHYNGTSYRSPSDKAFARLLGRVSTNGWNDWHANLPHGREPLSRIRTRLLESTRTNVAQGSSAEDQASRR